MKRLSATLCSAATAAALVLAAIATPPHAHAQFDDVGVITFPTSATAAAQEHFLRGVAILHSFGWKQAREQFHAAQAIDPDFALAYWGESLAYNHPLVTQMDPTEPRKALERLGATPEERLAKAPTEREKGLLRAVEILWGEGEHRDRAVGYMEAMAGLRDAYPDDPEIAAFYALSLLTATRATRDLSERWNVRAGTIALQLLSDNPVHPGAAHYTIHAFDNPVMAPLALDAAHAFADIAPAVSHARHMPTHIFIQHGMWDPVSGHNQSAYDVAVELWEPGDALGDAVHAMDWGQYGDLQRGDYAKARLWMERLAAMVEHEGFEVGGARGAAGTARARGAVPLLKSRYIVETEEWEIQPISDDSRTSELLATGLSAARTGDVKTLAAAEKALAGESDGEGYDHVMHMEVSALHHAAMGHGDMAIEQMDDAVATVEAMAPPRGSANPVKPVHELYGEILLDLGKPEDAAAMFETSLRRMPNRPRSLLGLARAHAASGNGMLAAEAYGKVAALWGGRDGTSGLDEARGFLEERAGEADARMREARESSFHASIYSAAANPVQGSVREPYSVWSKLSVPESEQSTRRLFEYTLMGAALPVAPAMAALLLGLGKNDEGGLGLGHGLLMVGTAASLVTVPVAAELAGADNLFRTVLGTVAGFYAGWLVIMPVVDGKDNLLAPFFALGMAGVTTLISR